MKEVGTVGKVYIATRVPTLNRKWHAARSVALRPLSPYNIPHFACSSPRLKDLLLIVMESPTTPRFNIPKPESGLAEWTQKIKALQRQVDADEVEEQRKLEQEIAASRLARVRRGTGRTSGVNLREWAGYFSCCRVSC